MAKYIYEFETETVEINSLIDPHSEWIMNCPTPVLIETCKKCLTLIDDLQQFCYDCDAHDDVDELVNYYSIIENYARNVNPSDAVTLEYRKEILSICKSTTEIGMIHNYPFSLTPNS